MLLWEDRGADRQCRQGEEHCFGRACRAVRGNSYRRCGDTRPSTSSCIDALVRFLALFVSVQVVFLFANSCAGVDMVDSIAPQSRGARRANMQDGAKRGRQSDLDERLNARDVAARVCG